MDGALNPDNYPSQAVNQDSHIVISFPGTICDKKYIAYVVRWSFDAQPDIVRVGATFYKRGEFAWENLKQSQYYDYFLDRVKKYTCVSQYDCVIESNI